MLAGLSTVDWQATAEVEAVLNVTRSACFLSQYETCYTGGYSACLKQLQIDTLRSGSLSVIEISQVGESNSLQRSTVSSNSLTRIGKITLTRAVCEAQRRYCPKAANCSSDEEKYSVKLSKQDYIATFLDPRLCHAAYLRPKAVEEAKEIYAEEYVAYAKTAILFELKMAQATKSTAGGCYRDNKVTDPTRVKVKRAALSAEQQNVEPAKEFAKLKRRSGNFSDDDDDAALTFGSMWGAVVAPRPPVPAHSELLKEAKRVHKNWRAMSRTIPWEKYLPSLKERAADIKRRREKREKASWNVVFDLLNVPLGKLIAEIKKRDPERERYGFLPYMAKTWLGRLMAESFSERMLSNANIVINPGNMRLNPVEMEQLVVLRMNRDFMVSGSL
jgi:hypothetical protein